MSRLRLFVTSFSNKHTILLKPEILIWCFWQKWHDENTFEFPIFTLSIFYTFHLFLDNFSSYQVSFLWLGYLLIFLFHCFQKSMASSSYCCYFATNYQNYFWRWYKQVWTNWNLFLHSSLLYFHFVIYLGWLIVINISFL